MKEIHEFRIFEKYYHLLSQPNNAKFNGAVYVLNISKEDPLFQEIGVIYEKLIKEKKFFFSSWQVKRSYTKKEIADAKLFWFKIKTAFEPTGEECGTIYDETVACEICGANRKQIGPLKLKKGSIPQKDIVRTIVGEIIVSERFVTTFSKRRLEGMSFGPVVFGKEISSNYYQLVTSSPELELTSRTVVGSHPFDLSTSDIEASEYTICGYKLKSEKIIRKCPKGHNIGSRLISEPYVFNSPSINVYDFFISKQKIGSKQGLFRPEPIYFCSQAFRNMVEEEKLSGFDFEITHIE